jgi:hypothetical protein
MDSALAFSFGHCFDDSGLDWNASFEADAE